MSKAILTLIVGLGLGIAGTSEAAQSAAAEFLGAWAPHRAEETYSIAAGYTGSGRPSPAQRLTEVRDAVTVPEHYGNLIAVTQSGTAAVLWYADRSGTVRNVVLYDPGTVLYRADMGASEVVDIRRR